MLKKLTNSIKENIKRTAENTINDLTSKAEGFVGNISSSIDMQNYVLDVMSRMEGRSDLYVWSRGYWSQYDHIGKVVPLLDRKAYMKKGQSFKKGKVYKMGPMFQGEISIGASVGDMGTVYNLDDLKCPAQYAVAKDKDTVMLFNWKE